MPDQLLTTDTQLHSLEQALDKAREGTKAVSVDKEALRSLLRDHVTLCTVVRGRKQITISSSNKDMESMK